MISASPYVVVDDVKASLDYYQNIFGGDTKILNENAGAIMHAELHIGNSLIHFSSSYGGRTPKGENEKIILQLESADEMRKIYETLKTDGQATVELQETFFGALHGQVTDNKNNITWVMNYFK